MQATALILREMGAPHPYAQSQPLKLEKITLDDPGPGEVLVRITAAGLCHSDLSVINGDRPRPLPMALGHEATGVVEAVGDHVSGLAVGDHVISVFVPSCGKCLPCSEGRPALCESAIAHNTAGTLVSGERRITDSEGNQIHHHLGCSAFADYAVMSVDSLVKVDKGLAPEHAALFGCAVLTGMGAVINTANLSAGQSVAVVGLGGVGLAALLGAVAGGAGDVIAVDLHPEKLEFAKSLGATAGVIAGPDAADEIREITKGGVEIAVDTAGVVPALETAYKATKRGGTTVTASLPNPAATWSISPVQLVAEERTIKGSYVGSAVPTRDIPRYIKLFENGQLPVDRLLSDKINLTDMNSALDHLHSGHALRQVVMMDG